MNSKLLIYILSGAALIVVWIFVAFIPIYNQFSTIDTSISEAENKLADYKRTVLLLPEYVKTRKELAAKKAMLNSSLYTKDNILSLFEQFYTIADKHNMEIVEILPPVEELLRINRVSPDSASLLILNVSIKVHGDYVDFGKFSGTLEESPFFRGTNHCHIFGSPDRTKPILFDIGFKSLLGSLKDKV